MRTLTFVLEYAKKYTRSLVITALSMSLLVGVELLVPQILRSLVSHVEEGVWDATTSRYVTQLALGLLGVYLIRGVLGFVRSYAAHVAGWGVVADSRRRIYDHLQKLSLRFYEDQQTGQLMSRMVNDSDMFERLIAHAVPDTVVHLLMLVGVSAMLISIEWRLMLLTLIPVPFIILAMQGFARYVRPAFLERQKVLADLNAILNDNLSGIREIKAFTREEIEMGRVNVRIEEHRYSLLKALRLMAVFGPAVEFSASLGTVIVLFFGGRLAFQNVLSIADLLAFFLYLEMFYRPIRMLTASWEALQESLASAERVAELLDEEPDVVDNSGAVDLVGRAEGALSFKNVTFGYSRGDTVLENINLDIPANAVVALVGPTGVGKTTMAGLLPRFYDVSEGSITLDGTDLRELTLRSLRQQIAIVLQDVFLFHGTVRDNLLFGRPDATDEEVIRAAQIANAHDFILQLSDGYDTMIGERGVKLSGGQKQRLSIARAVLKDAPILILDEATSSVDTETELLIQQALERLMVGRTTIIIAHRLSTVRSADMIVVLEERKIAELGTHEQLMANENGLYRHLSEVQSQIDPKLIAMGIQQRRTADAAQN